VSTDPGVWAAAVATLMVFSYLLDADNPAWLLIEHIYMALAFGYTIAYAWQNTLRPLFVGARTSPGIATGAWWLAIPVLFALLVYLRYFPRWRWVARYPMSLWLGYGAGVILANVPKTFMGQVVASFYPLWGHLKASTYLNGWVLLITLLGTLAYFFFTVERRGAAMKLGSAIGRWTLMVALGASFASTLLFRWTLAYGRFDFLLHTWLGL
jgi:hypothetical protein